MEIKLKKIYLLEYILLLCYVFYVFIAHWIWYGRGIQESLMILISIVILFGYLIKDKFWKVRPYQLINFVIIFILICICFWGILNANTQIYLIQDLKAMVGTVIVSFGIIVSIRKLIQGGHDFWGYTFKFLNIYYFLNNCIILIQYFVPYFLMNRGAIASVNNVAYYDQLTGFFGINGTTRWDVWGIFLILLNFYYYYKRNDKKIMIYNVFLIVFTSIISMLNSARSFLIIAPMLIAVYLLVVHQTMLKKRVKQIIVVFGVIGIGVLVYNHNSYVNEFINDLIEDKVTVYLTFDLDYMVETNDDRAKALDYVLDEGKEFGLGIGSVPMHSSTKTVKYIGLNSISTYILMIGKYGYLLWTYMLASFAIKWDRKKRFTKGIIYFCILIILSYFLPIYSGLTLLPAVLLIFYLYSLDSSS